MTVISGIRWTIVTLAVVSLAPSMASAGMISLSSNRVRNRVFDADGNNDATATFRGTSIPTSHLNDATTDDGQFWSRTQVDYSGLSGGSTLRHGVDLKRDGGLSDFSYAYEYASSFTVSADTSYKASGVLNAIDVSTSNAGRVYFRSYLRDASSGNFLYLSTQDSRNTLNETFTLGGAGGDRTNAYIGSLSGNLLAGRTYKWYSYALIQAVPDEDDGASATGFFKLETGDNVSASNNAALVPEPTSLALWGLGTVCLGMIRHRRRVR